MNGLRFKHSETTLSRKINQVTIAVVTVAGVFAICFILLQSFFNFKVRNAAIQENLLRSSQTQIDSLLPVFILPEQRQGLQVFINELAKRESLDVIQVIQPEQLLPEKFRDCKMSDEPSSCVSFGFLGASALSAVVMPIRADNQTFGYLLKARRVGSLLGAGRTLESIELIVAVLLLIMLVSVISVSRVVSQQVPMAFHELTNWIERTIREGDTVETPHLPFTELNELTRRISEIIRREQSARERARLGAMASQVSHDIRSPLSALSMVAASLKEMPEEKRLIIRNATQRINDIANGLLQTAKNPTRQNFLMSGANEPVLLMALLDSIVSEKRMQFRDRMNVELHEDLTQGYGLFAEISATEFARVISNLVNNSVEAIAQNGRVEIAIKSAGRNIEISVTDNGGGISPELLKQIGDRGVSFRKSDGTSGFGLGLSHARETVENVGGNLRIESTIDVGTKVTVSLPCAETPTWFLDRLSISSQLIVVSVDDDQTIHQIWSGRLRSATGPNSHVQHIRFSTTDQLKDWVVHRSQKASSGPVLYLVDFEFIGQIENGLDAVEAAGIADSAILVTSRYEERQVRQRAESLGVKVLPKSLAPFIPITVESERMRPDAVVIDDDVAIVHTLWKLAASEKSKYVICCRDADEFFAQSPNLDRSSPIFIDVSLGNGVRGEDVAIRISQHGFSEITLATGYDHDSLVVPSCVKRVIGKEPCFS